MATEQGRIPARAQYADTDRERLVPEAPKSAARTAFERDRARVLHSSALRRLGAKTQVLGPGSGDFVRTRLTHSLEVAQVGRELGKVLGCDPDVVETACLSHDIGHPPFGHNGERALNQAAKAAGGFEGNAQTLRVLVRLEPKVLAADGTPAGLNLTRASVDATCKYPWTAGEGPAGSNAKKFGVYDDDAEIFAWARAGAVAGRRCLEAQIMDLADDIAYSVHDFEDAVQTGRAPASCLHDEEQRAAVITAGTAWYRRGPQAVELAASMDRLAAAPYWRADFDGSYRALAALKDMTSQLIGRFCRAAHDATRERYGPNPLARYQADLIVPAATRAEIAVMKSLAVHYVMAPRELEPVYLEQRSIIFDLVATFMDRGADVLEEPFAGAFRATNTEAGQLRAVVDQVASLTDTSAYQWHARLCGMLGNAF